MTVFDTAAASLAADPARSEAGAFLPSEGGSEVCRLQFSTPGQVDAIGPTGAFNPGTRIDVFHAGLSRPPAKGDQITARSATWDVTAVVGQDALGHYSTLDVDPV